MTTEELKALTDEELIETVATNVMGLCKHPQLPDGKKTWCKTCGKHGVIKRNGFPNYLTDWNHTWQVVEKMAPFWFMMNSRHHDGDWWVSFNIPSVEPNSIIDKNPQRAICLAALLASAPH